ncbi:hypothetical protein BDW69DRAFT_14488 [Aspergillus filifer]
MLMLMQINANNAIRDRVRPHLLHQLFQSSPTSVCCLALSSPVKCLGVWTWKSAAVGDGIVGKRLMGALNQCNLSDRRWHVCCCCCCLLLFFGIVWLVLAWLDWIGKAGEGMRDNAWSDTSPNASSVDREFEHN